LDAEAERQEQVLSAEGQKESQILMAEGEAKAIIMVSEAKATALEVIGKQATTEGGKAAVSFELARNAIEAHKAIAKEGTVILSDGKTGDNISTTVAQAISVSNAINSK